jgi:hypothetical protein
MLTIVEGDIRVYAPTLSSPVKPSKLPSCCAFKLCIGPAPCLYCLLRNRMAISVFSRKCNLSKTESPYLYLERMVISHEPVLFSLKKI